MRDCTVCARTASRISRPSELAIPNPAKTAGFVGAVARLLMGTERGMDAVTAPPAETRRL